MNGEIRQADLQVLGRCGLTLGETSERRRIEGRLRDPSILEQIEAEVAEPTHQRGLHWCLAHLNAQRDRSHPIGVPKRQVVRCVVALDGEAADVDDLDGPITARRQWIDACPIDVALHLLDQARVHSFADL